MNPETRGRGRSAGGGGAAGVTLPGPAGRRAQGAAERGGDHRCPRPAGDPPDPARTPAPNRILAANPTPTSLGPGPDPLDPGPWTPAPTLDLGPWQ